MEIGRLLFPALRWDAATGFAHERERIEAALALGVGGFIVFGGEAQAVRALVTSIRSRTHRPLLFGADLERGAGQQFHGATPLPPAAALGALGDLDVLRRSAELTAREARALGIDWIYAPVADVDLEPQNPIVGTRAFGTDPARVAAAVAAWVRGCAAGGALSCAKHFPGHGRTTADSHVELPRVVVERAALELDLAPFRAAIDAGVDTIMTAHVAYSALDPSGAPATLSRAILHDLLRDQLRFTGLVVSDALIMEGVLAGGGAGRAAVRALAAGCDALLYPEEPAHVATVIEAAISHDLPEGRVTEALARVDTAARKAAAMTRADEWGREEDRAWTRSVAQRTVLVVRGRPTLARACDLITVDDDVGGPYPPGRRDVFPATLRSGGVDVRETQEVHPDRAALVAVYADIRAWKGRPGLSARAREAVQRALARRPAALVALFAHPRLAAELPPNAAVVAAWGGEPLMQEAAAHRLLQAGAAV